MKSFAKHVYRSQQWKKCRISYLKSVGGLCERCLQKGIYRPAEIVHHKIFLDEKNASDPEVCYAFKNLEAVCREHHEEIHNNKLFLPRNKSEKRRYDVMADGSVIIYDDKTSGASTM